MQKTQYKSKGYKALTLGQNGKNKISLRSSTDINVESLKRSMNEQHMETLKEICPTVQF
jgi:malate/lactate dehydrogenase